MRRIVTAGVLALIACAPAPTGNGTETSDPHIETQEIYLHDGTRCVIANYSHTVGEIGITCDFDNGE